MNKLDRNYQDLLKKILTTGTEKKDRTTVGTLSIFGEQIRHQMGDGFPLLTTKKMAWKSIVIELLWFLRGDTNIKYLLDNNCHIWDGDAYKNFLMNNPPHDHLETKTEFLEKIKNNNSFAEKWGDLGPIYGRQWRSWGTTSENRIDQIKNLIKELKSNPDSRRLMVNAWNVDGIEMPYDDRDNFQLYSDFLKYFRRGEVDYLDLDEFLEKLEGDKIFRKKYGLIQPTDKKMVLPPCHYGFQLYTRDMTMDEKIKEAERKFGIQRDENSMDYNIFLNSNRKYISLMWNQRSVDTPLGLPFNIASYALLLEIIARMVDMTPLELIGNLGDTHIYKNQIEGVNTQLLRDSFELPRLEISENVNFFGDIDDMLNSCTHLDFNLVGYKSHPSIKIPLSN
jgi:thymidylate synthase